MSAKKVKSAKGWAIANDRGGLLIDSGRMPVFWRLRAAKTFNEFYQLNERIVRVEIAPIPAKPRTAPKVRPRILICGQCGKRFDANKPHPCRGMAKPRTPRKGKRCT